MSKKSDQQIIKDIKKTLRGISNKDVSIFLDKVDIGKREKSIDWPDTEPHNNFNRLLDVLIQNNLKIGKYAGNLNLRDRTFKDNQILCFPEKIQGSFKSDGVLFFDILEREESENLMFFPKLVEGNVKLDSCFLKNINGIEEKVINGEEISLSFNDIEDFRPLDKCFCFNLKRLYLLNNKVKYLPEKTMSGLEKLFISNLEYNEHNKNALLYSNINSIFLKQISIENFLMLKNIKKSIELNDINIGGKSILLRGQDNKYKVMHYFRSELDCVFNSLEDKKIVDQEGLKKVFGSNYILFESYIEKLSLENNVSSSVKIKQKQKFL